MCHTHDTTKAQQYTGLEVMNLFEVVERLFESSF